MSPAQAEKTVERFHLVHLFPQAPRDDRQSAKSLVQLCGCLGVNMLQAKIQSIDMGAEIAPD